MKNRDVNLVIGTIAVYMDDVLPGIVEYELKEYGQYNTLEWVRDQVEAWDRILYNREEKDIVDFVNKYILAVHDLDIEMYWNMGAEDLREYVVYQIYHECGKMLGMEINMEADKYLD